MVLLEGVFKDSLILELGGCILIKKHEVWSFFLLKKKTCKRTLKREVAESK